jgi:hypothetical protein
MKARTLSVICLLACLVFVIPILAQGPAPADPLSGTWTGDWGPNAGDRNQVSVELKWDGKSLTGVVKSLNPSRPDVPLTNSSYAAATQTVKMEAQTVNPRTQAPVKYVMDGKLSGNTMTGSWNHDSSKGDFKLTKK